MAKTKLEICRKCCGTGHIYSCDETSIRSKTCEDCHGIGFVRVPQTNADRIRAMSDEELAKEFADCAIGLYCDTRKKGLPELPENVKREVFDSLLEWLKQPV